MKKILSLLAFVCVFHLGLTNLMFAQEDSTSSTTTTEEVASTTTDAATTTATETSSEVTSLVSNDDKPFHQYVKEKFVEGGVGFMGIVLLCLILGLAFAIERIIVLNLATTNTEKLIEDVTSTIKSKGVDAAQQMCATSRGPVASIFAQGLLNAKGGVDMVEKSVMSYGSVEMSKLERGLVWISLFISLAPMLGFMGTVIGMIEAFDVIESVGDISPSIVAGGIKVALLTTVAGLIVAIILQIFYNYCVSKIDSLVSEMEEASIRLVDILVRHDLTK